ncbi:hypothetical protein D9M71_763910 [compost metagenome]
MRVGSPFTCSCSMPAGSCRCRPRPRCWALCWNDWTLLVISSPRLKSMCSNCSAARSMREKARMSLMTFSKCPVDSLATAV